MSLEVIKNGFYCDQSLFFISRLRELALKSGIRTFTSLSIFLHIQESRKEIILKNKYATQKQLDEIDAKVKAGVAECEKFAEDSPFPDKSVMYDAVYEQEEYPFIKHKID